MIASFDSDIITLDYRVRGFTRPAGQQILHRPRHHLDPELHRQTNLRGTTLSI
jgi:hypothetical protein